MTLLDHGVDATLRNRYGTSVLHFAARRGNFELCKRLLDSLKINCDVRDMAEVIVFK